MIDRKECDHLIGAVAADLADTAPDPTLPTEWCGGWDAAVREHGEPLAEQLRLALAEIDALTADHAEAVTTCEAMRTEIEILRCGDLGDYFDSELSPARRAAFAQHLATCERCASELHGIAQLDAHTDGLRAIEARRRAVFDAAVAWRRGGGTIAEIAGAVDALEDGNG